VDELNDDDDDDIVYLKTGWSCLFLKRM